MWFCKLISKLFKSINFTFKIDNMKINYELENNKIAQQIEAMLIKNDICEFVIQNRVKTQQHTFYNKKQDKYEI